MQSRNYKGAWYSAVCPSGQGHYEVRYEVDNRPDWLPVPMVGLLRHIGAGTPGV